MRLVLTLLLAVSFTATACSGEPNGSGGSGAGASSPSPRQSPSSSPSPRPTPTAEPTGAPPPDCPNQEAVVSDPGANGPGAADGDIDGDGSRDTVSLAVDPGAPPGCQGFVVVDGSSGTLAEEIDDPELSIDLGFPAIEGIVPVDDRPGDEIVVRITAGASTVFAGLFTIHEGTLTRVRVTGASPSGHLFPSGGSVGHVEGSDCVGGRVVVSMALPAGKKYEVTRTFYDFSGTELVPAASEQHVVRPGGLDNYPEFTGPPFSRCG